MRKFISAAREAIRNAIIGKAMLEQIQVTESMLFALSQKCESEIERLEEHFAHEIDDARDTVRKNHEEFLENTVTRRINELKLEWLNDDRYVEFVDSRIGSSVDIRLQEAIEEGLRDYDFSCEIADELRDYDFTDEIDRVVDNWDWQDTISDALTDEDITDCVDLDVVAKKVVEELESCVAFETLVEEKVETAIDETQVDEQAVTKTMIESPEFDEAIRKATRQHALRAAQALVAEYKDDEQDDDTPHAETVDTQPAKASKGIALDEFGYAAMPSEQVVLPKPFVDPLIDLLIASEQDNEEE